MSAVNIVLKNIKAISFDLDDTLYDNGPVILNAFQKLYEHLILRYPRVASLYNFDDFLKASKSFRSVHPSISDLSELRRRHISQVIKESGYQPLANDEAFDVFWQARQAVNLYPQAIEVLKKLSAKMPLVAISNGNACTKTIGIDHFFQLSISASDGSKPKPDSSMFLFACDQLAIKPKELLHVGDHLEIDVHGALNAGCRAVWFKKSDRRSEEPTSNDFVSKTNNIDLVIKDLSELLNLRFR